MNTRLSIAILGADMTLSPSWAFCIDIGRRNAGAVSGTMNMAGNLGALVTALAFAYLKEWTDSTTPYFLTAAVLNLLAIAAWLATRPDRPLGPNPNSFGHYGTGGSLGFADPDARIGFGYVMNDIIPRWRNSRNHALIDAVYSCL